MLIRRFSKFTSIGLVLFLFSGVNQAQTSRPKASSTNTTRRHVPSVPSRATHDCGNGMTLKLTGPAALQGGLLEIDVSGAAPLDDLSGNWAGGPVRFWADVKHVQHALLGVDLERTPGTYDLSVSARQGGGDLLTCSMTLTVKRGQFAIEALRVAPGFVELSREDRARADKEREEVHEILADVTPQPLWTGKFRFPLAGNRSGHNFGKRRVLNGKSSAPHTGLDIGAPAGTPIHASQSGHVALAANLFFSGNTVILDHGLGVYTFYGHMKSMSVVKGDEVKADEVLGRVGATGRATGPHLHWSLIVDGARVNPLGILRLRLQ